MLFDGEYELSGWSDAQLKHLTLVLVQPPEALIEKGLVKGTPVHGTYGLDIGAVNRALDVIRAEKLKVCFASMAFLVSTFKGTSALY